MLYCLNEELKNKPKTKHYPIEKILQENWNLLKYYKKQKNTFWSIILHD